MQSDIPATTTTRTQVPLWPALTVVSTSAHADLRQVLSIRTPRLSNTPDARGTPHPMVQASNPATANDCTSGVVQTAKPTTNRGETLPAGGLRSEASLVKSLPRFFLP